VLRPPLSGKPRIIEAPSIEPTADGWVGFNTNTRAQFDDFLVMIERPDLIGEPNWPELAQFSAQVSWRG
jgi:hypothetical protein